MVDENQKEGFKEKAEETGRKMEQLGGKMMKWGVKFTIGLTIPIILIAVGAFILPYGIILWVFAILIFIGVFFGKKKKKTNKL